MKKTFVTLLTALLITGCTASPASTKATTEGATSPTTSSAMAVTENSKAETSDSKSSEETKAEETKTEETKAEEPQAEAQGEGQTGIGQTISFKDFDLVIRDVKRTKDYEGKNAILVKYDFTNKAEKATEAMTAAYITAYQDGVELSTAIGESLTDHSMKNVKTGKTIKDCIKLFESDPKAGPITLNVKPLMSFDDSEQVEFEVAYPEK